jgi:hypothetical protein
MICKINFVVYYTKRYFILINRKTLNCVRGLFSITIPTAACRRSNYQLLRIECATWSSWQIPTDVFPVFWTGAATFLSSSPSVVLTRLSGPRSRHTNFFSRSAGNRICSQELWPLDHRGGSKEYKLKRKSYNECVLRDHGSHRSQPSRELTLAWPPYITANRKHSCLSSTCLRSRRTLP